jgi:ATP-dependent Lon protease
MPTLDRKANGVFGGKVVRKDLVRKVKVAANVPVFVLEYLLGNAITPGPTPGVGNTARRPRPG